MHSDGSSYPPKVGTGYPLSNFPGSSRKAPPAFEFFPFCQSVCLSLCPGRRNYLHEGERAANELLSLSLSVWERGFLALDLATKVESVSQSVTVAANFATARSVGENDAAESHFMHR